MIELLLPPIQRGLLYGGVLLLAGVAGWRIFIAPGTAARLSPDGPGRTASIERRMTGVGAVIALLLLPVWGLRLYTQLQDFRDPFAPLSEDLSYLVFEAFWGTIWLVQGALLVGLAAGFALARHRPPQEVPARVPWGTVPPAPPLPVRWKLLGLGVVSLALTLALSSHAMSVPSNRPLAVALDAAHVLAAGSWIGALSLILVVRESLARPPEEPRSSLLAAQLQAFSPVAMVSVGVLLFAGFILSTQHVGTWENLWASQYGRTLLLKILVTLAVLLLGALNWRRGLPSLDTPEGHARTRRRAGLEVAAAVIVIAITAVLTGTPMPEGVH